MKVLSLVVLTAALAYASLLTEQELRGRHWHKKHMPQEYMEINDNDYEQNKEYLYEYNGQLMTGLPQSSEQHSATRIQALVKIIFKAPTKAVMKIEKVRFGYFNDKVAQPKFVHDFDLFEQVPIEEEKKALLKEPLEFAYEQGLVQDIYFTEQEQPWSANIKRAILNLMQVNVNKQRRTDSQVERLSKIEQRFASSSSESMEEREQPIGQLTDFFTVMENTMEGECETAYTMVKSGEQQVNVTKTINFDKCQRRPEIRYNHRFHKICPTCKTQYEEDKFLQESTVMRQQVKLGQSGSVLIKKAETESLYTVVPITEEGNVIQTYSITQLRLVKKQPVEEVEISRRQFAVKSDSGLIYTPDWDVMKEQYFLNGEEQFQEMTPYSDIKSKVEFVQSIMQKLVHFMRESVEEEAPRQFVRLVKSLRLVTKPELEKIMLEVYEQQQEEFTREEQHKVKSIFVDALAAAGTKTTIEQLVELIKQEKISPLKASIAIRKLQSTRVVSEKIIEQIWQLTSEEYQRQAPVTIYQSAYLTVGSLLNAYCQAELDKLAVAFKPTVAQEQRCTRDTKKEWTNKLIARFEQCSDELCRVTVLKALANAGLDQSANQLEQIIKNKKYNTVVRTEAILATRQLLEIMPRKVEKMLMPVFMSKREQPVVRMTAFFKLIQTQPEKFILDQLTHSLHKEQNKQVAAFVYTTLQEFANSTNPCLERMSEDIKLSLAHARGLPVEQWMQRSKFLRAEIFPQQTSNGAMFDIQSLFGNNSMLPTDISTTLRLNVNKQWYRNAFQVGIMQQNVEQYLRQLTRRFSHNLQNLDTAFENIVDGRWSEEQTSPKFRKELNNIFDDLSIEEREEQWVRQEQKQSIAYLYFRIMNQDYGFLPLSKEILPEQILDILTSEQMSLRKLLKAGERLLKAQEIKMPFDVSTAAQIHEMSKKIPTTIGLPLIFSSKLPMVAQARGHLVVKIDKEAKKVELELIETKPSIVVSQVTKVETWSPIVNTGLKVVAQAKIYAPLSVKIEAKLENMRPIVKIAMKPVDKKYELVRIQTRPSTLVRVWPKQISQYQEPEERTIQGEQWTRINKAQKTFGEQALGIKIQTYYQWHSQPLKHVQGTPIPLFAGPNQMVVRVEPGMDMPREIELTVEGNLFEKLGKSAGLKPEFDNFYTSESDEYLNERSESSSQESREYQRERRQSHEQYYKQYESEQSTAHQIKLTLQGKGSSIERRAQLTVDCRLESSQQKAGKCEVEIKRTPIPELESSEWKLQSKIEFLYPKSVRSVQDIDAARKLMIRVKSQWGEQSQEQKNVDIKIVGEQSRKMEQLVKESLYQQHSRMENQERRSLFSPVAQYEHVQKLGLLDQYKVDVDYKNVPKQLKNITEQVLDALKAYYYMQTEIDHVPREQHNSFQQDGKKGQIRVLVNVDPISRQAVNVTIEKLNEKVAIKDIPLKYALPVASMQRQGKPAQSLYELVSEQASSYEQNLCKVRSERVTSFNDVEYMAPISTCYSLVAKDCTRRSQFAVLLKRLSESSERKQLKIVARNVELIVKPKKTQSQEQNEEIVELEYILNGEKKHISEIERVLEHGEHVVLRVTEEETGYARIQLPEAGIKVYFDGYAANVKASSMHGQRLCGLCGQLEPEYYEEECELRDAENECVSAQSTQELKRLFKSYVQDKEECSGEQQRFYSAEEKYEYEPLQWTEQHYQHIDEQYNDEEYQREVQPVRRTRVIEQLHELCFSKQPVPKCPKGTQPTDFKQGHVKVAYTCMPRNDVQAEEYLRQAQQERVVVDVEELPASFTQTEKVPQQCEKIQY